MSLRLSAIGVSLVCALSASASEARERDWAVGAFGLVGFAESYDRENLTPGVTIYHQGSDTAGVNNGAGLWLNYDLKSTTQLPLTLELGSTWRYRHDENIFHTVAATNYVANNNTMTVDTMASVLYNFQIGKRWKPYVGAGVGIAYLYNQLYYEYALDARDVGSSTSWNFAWQLQGGVNYALSDTWDLRVDYRYIDLGAVPTMTTPVSNARFAYDLASHDIRFGALWKF